MADGIQTGTKDMKATVLKNIIKAISRQAADYRIAVQDIITIEGEEAYLVIYDFLDGLNGEVLGRTAAVVYEDGTCFSRDDWQDGQYPTTPEDIEDYNWYDHEHGRYAVMFNGLPRHL